MKEYDFSFVYNECAKILRRNNDLIENLDDEIKDVLVAALGITRPNLFVVDTVKDYEYKKAIMLAKKRSKGMPLNKATKCACFRGVDFYINRHVLAPRQETELLVDVALDRIAHGSKVLDLCTGSGVIAICIALESDANVVASDISRKALKVAKRNALMLNAKVDFIKSNCFKKINGKFDLIVSNPPYIESEIIPTLNREVTHYDPVKALDGGLDGLDFYRIIAREGYKFLTDDGVIVCEIGYNQADAVKDIFSSYKNIEVLKDYSGNDRILIAHNKVIKSK